MSLQAAGWGHMGEQKGSLLASPREKQKEAWESVVGIRVEASRGERGVEL